jgi:hypothetical protein
MAEKLLQGKLMLMYEFATTMELKNPTAVRFFS